MENDLLFEDDEEIDDELPVGEGFLPEADAPPKEGVVAPVKVEVDTNGIGRTIAEALAAQGIAPPGLSVTWRARLWGISRSRCSDEIQRRGCRE